MDERQAAVVTLFAAAVSLGAWHGLREAPRRVSTTPVVAHEREPTHEVFHVPAAKAPDVTRDAGPPPPMRIEVRVGVHLATAFGSGTRIDQHLENLDAALISRLDLYAHAHPGSALTLWENAEQELVAAAVPLDDGSRFLAARYDGPDAEPGWYDARGFLLDGPVKSRPVPLSYVTSAFGERLHPLLGVKRMHRGVDYGAPAGTPVRSVARGVISAFTISQGAGIAVEIAHDDGYISRYLHLQGVTPDAVEGTRVRAGQVIGYVGSSGLATGPHLHFELFRDGALLDAAGLLPPSSTRLPPRALTSHQAELRALVMAQLQEPTVAPAWGQPTTVRAPPPPLEAFGPLPEELTVSPAEDRAREQAELLADQRAEARALAELEARTLAEAEREAQQRERAMAAEREELEREREREARELARVAEEARRERTAEEEARRKAKERAEARRKGNAARSAGD